MHEVKFSDEVLERIRRRRGRLHVHDELAAARSALLVVDMQNNFVAPGMPSQVAAARGIVPNINRLAEAARAAGATVVWIRNVFTPENRADWSVFFGGMYRPEIAEAVYASLVEGHEGAELWPELAVEAGDWHVTKDRFSAFIQNASDLEARLRDAGIDTLLITGTVTNVCCESTARDAMMRNFKVVMISDANAAHTDADHNATLASVWQIFGDVMTTDEAIARLRPAAAVTEKAAAAS